MAKYDIAFYIAGFFLIGVLLASLGLGILISSLLSVLVAVIFLLFYFLSRQEFKKRLIWLAVLSLFIIVGSSYYLWDNYRFRNQSIVFDKKIEFQGVIASDPEIGIRSQKFIVNGVLVNIARYPQYHYGDLIILEGMVKRPYTEQYANILAKDRVLGIMSFPKIQFVANNHGSVVKSVLFKLKSRSLNIFQKTLSQQKAAFLGGITFGHRADFSEEFEAAMSLSGTTHLVALSGYNVSVIVIAIGATLGYFFKRRWRFFLTVIFILGFVLMTGAEASIVRAAIMGIIFLISQQTSRVYSFRNAVTLAALAMVLANPKILFFDLGFQLSFFALLGIIYLRPAIIRFFKISANPGILSWRENALTTIAAQLAVVPLLLANFGVFSLSSFIANILILSAIPITMFLGFFMVLMGAFSLFLAEAISWLANLFLSYELAIINIFSKFNFLLIQTNSFNVALSIIYFSVLATFIVYTKNNSEKSL